MATSNSTSSTNHRQDIERSLSDIFIDEDDTRRRFQDILYQSPGAKAFFNLPPRPALTMAESSYSRSQSSVDSFNRSNSLLSPVNLVLRGLSNNNRSAGAPTPSPKRTMTPDRMPRPRVPRVEKAINNRSAGAPTPSPKQTMTPDRMPRPREPRVEKGMFQVYSSPSAQVLPPTLTPPLSRVRESLSWGPPPILQVYEKDQAHYVDKSTQDLAGVDRSVEQEALEQDLHQVGLDSEQQEQQVVEGSIEGNGQPETLQTVIDRGQPRETPQTVIDTGQPQVTPQTVIDTGQPEETPQNVELPSNAGPSETVMDGWYLTQPAKRIIVIEGHRRGDPEQELWHSSAISKRKSARLLITTSGSEYRLQGPMNIEMSLEHGFSSDVVKKFLKGFPVDWKEIIQEQCVKKEQQKRDKVKNKDVPQQKKTEKQPPSKSKSTATSKTKSATTSKTKSATAPRKDRPVTKTGGKQKEKVETPVGKNVILGTPKFKTPLLIPIDEVQCSRSGRRILPPLAYWTCERQRHNVRLDKVEVIAGSSADQSIVSANTPRLTGLEEERVLLRDSSSSSHIKKRHQNGGSKTDAKKATARKTNSEAKENPRKKPGTSDKTQKNGREAAKAKKGSCNPEQSTKSSKSKEKRNIRALETDDSSVETDNEAQSRNGAKNGKEASRNKKEDIPSEGRTTQSRNPERSSKSSNSKEKKNIRALETDDSSVETDTEAQSRNGAKNGKETSRNKRKDIPPEGKNIQSHNPERSAKSSNGKGKKNIRALETDDSSVETDTEAQSRNGAKNGKEASRNKRKDIPPEGKNIRSHNPERSAKSSNGKGKENIRALETDDSSVETDNEEQSRNRAKNGKETSCNERKDIPPESRNTRSRRARTGGHQKVGHDEVILVEESPNPAGRNGTTITGGQKHGSRYGKARRTENSKGGMDEVFLIEESPNPSGNGTKKTAVGNPKLGTNGGKTGTAANVQVRRDEAYLVEENPNPIGVGMSEDTLKNMKHGTAARLRNARHTRCGTKLIHDEELDREEGQNDIGKTKTSRKPTLDENLEEVGSTEVANQGAKVRMRVTCEKHPPTPHRTRSGKTWDDTEDVDLDTENEDLERGSSRNGGEKLARNKQKSSRKDTVDNTQEEELPRRNPTRRGNTKGGISLDETGVSGKPIASSRKQKLEDDIEVQEVHQEVQGRRRRLPRLAKSDHKQYKQDDPTDDEWLPVAPKKRRNAADKSLPAGDGVPSKRRRGKPSTSHQTRYRERIDSDHEPASDAPMVGEGCESDMKQQSSDTESTKQAKDDKKVEKSNTGVNLKEDLTFDIYGDVMNVLSQQKQRRETLQSKRKASIRAHSSQEDDKEVDNLMDAMIVGTERSQSQSKSATISKRNIGSVNLQKMPLLKVNNIGRGNNGRKEKPLTGSFQASPGSWSRQAGERLAVSDADGGQKGCDGGSANNCLSAKPSVETRDSERVTKKGKARNTIEMGDEDIRTKRGNTRKVRGSRKGTAGKENVADEVNLPEENKISQRPNHAQEEISTVESVLGDDRQAETEKSAVAKPSKLASKGPITLNAKKGTLKRKRQLREMAEHHNMGFEEDMLDATPYKQQKKKRILYSDDSDDDDDTHALGGKTPSLNIPSVQPFSSKKTPHPNWTPGLLQSVNRDKAEQYIFRMQKRNKLAKQKSTPVVARVTSKLGAKPNKFKNRFDEHEIDEAFKVTEITGNTDSDEDRDYYWSDEEALA